MIDIVIVILSDGNIKKNVTLEKKKLWKIKAKISMVIEVNGIRGTKDYDP